MDCTGVIRIFSGNYAPAGYLLCDGRTLNVNQYQQLFVVIGTTFGSSGPGTFNLPDFRGRIAIGSGSGLGLTPRKRGDVGGVGNVTLKKTELPSHNHNFKVSSKVADQQLGSNVYFANIQIAAGRSTINVSEYALTSNSQMSAISINNNPQQVTQSHDNLMPYQTIYYCICTGL